jgi:predicted short-subunit dehydrogenase-like oxidoreductase (DUF2520 family)
MGRSLNILGCGRVGRALGSLFVRHSIFSRVTVCNRTPESSRRAAAFVPKAKAVDSIAEMPPCDAWMIASADSAVQEAAQLLVAQQSLVEGNLVFHVSGAQSSEVLEPLRARGARLGSLHPVRSIASPELVVTSFTGTACAIEGDESARAELRTMVEAIGGKPFEVDSRAKMICHAGHVFASNYLVTVVDVARRLYEEAGIPVEVAETMLPPIVRGTVENVCALGTTEALTGPVVRGDASLVERQLSALSEVNPEIASLYRELVRHATVIAERRGHLPEEAVEALRRIQARQGA